jgi:hypothetical protein
VPVIPGVLHPFPIKESRPEIYGSRVSNGKGNASHLYFLIYRTEQGGGMGFIPTLQIMYISYRLHEAKNLGKFFSKKS